MKIMDRNGRLFGKISIVDVVVILVVLVMGAAIYYKTHQPQTGTKVTTTKIVYEMQLQNQPSTWWTPSRWGTRCTIRTAAPAVLWARSWTSR